MKLMDQLPPCFSQSYLEAQDKFRATCAATGLEVESYVHPATGIAGETLATLVARSGPADAQNLVIIISGTHGLEGLTGSGCQVAWLEQGLAYRPGDTAVLLIHMLNPWGCSWHRRQTEDNADLNRSFVDRRNPSRANDIYRTFHPLLVEGSSATSAAEDPAISSFFASRDFNEAIGALMMGQHEFPDGIGFCGAGPSWAQQTLEVILHRHAMRASRLAVIDLHTGLGPYGYGSLISLADSGSAELARARQWFGPSLSAVKEGQASYPTQGELLNWVAKRVPGQCTGVVIEYGTFDVRQLVMLLIDDARIWREGLERTPRADLVRTELLHFFYPASEDWFQYVAFRALQVIELTFQGLRSAGQRG